MNLITWLFKKIHSRVQTRPVPKIRVEVNREWKKTSVGKENFENIPSLSTSSEKVY